MHLFARALSLTALTSLGLASMPAPIKTDASSAASHQPAPAAGYCCSVAKVAAAEAHLPVRPVNPQAIVTFVTHRLLVNFQTHMGAEAMPPYTDQAATNRVYDGRNDRDRLLLGSRADPASVPRCSSNQLRIRPMKKVLVAAPGHVGR